jgi:ABC-type amino acid transport substrate-binding protein
MKKTTVRVLAASAAAAAFVLGSAVAGMAPAHADAATCRGNPVSVGFPGAETDVLLRGACLTGQNGDIPLCASDPVAEGVSPFDADIACQVAHGEGGWD